MPSSVLNAKHRLFYLILQMPNAVGAINITGGKKN